MHRWRLPTLLLVALAGSPCLTGADHPATEPPSTPALVAQVQPPEKAPPKNDVTIEKAIRSNKIQSPEPSPVGDAVLPENPAKPTPGGEAAPPPERIPVPKASRILTDGEVLVVAPGQHLLVESPAEPDRVVPILEASTGAIVWVRLPGRPRQVVVIRWLDTSNIKKLVEIEMLVGDLFVAVSPRGQPDRSLALRGRKRGVAVEASGGWRGLAHRTLKLHCEVDASLRLVGYGHPLLPGADDTAQRLGLHIFASLRPGALVQNAGDTTLVVEQYDQAAAAGSALRWSDAPKRVLLPPETSLTTNGGQFDLRHFYIPEPGQPAGPERTTHVFADMPAAARSAAAARSEATQADGAGRVADAPAGVVP